MTEHAQEIWMSLDIIGPQYEIDRFKSLCIIPECAAKIDGGHKIDFSRIIEIQIPVGDGRTGYRAGHTPWNFREFDDEAGFYSCAFDVDNWVPIAVFERLAEIFPTLAFHLDAIGSDDEFMAYGWFNGPLGGESFEYYDVPKNYWTTGSGHKRDSIKQEQHEVWVRNLRAAARKASLN